MCAHQADVAGWAAMAALLSASAGWLNLEPLLMRVSQQATAGACPELLDLMQVWILSRCIAVLQPITPPDKAAWKYAQEQHLLGLFFVFAWASYC